MWLAEWIITDSYLILFSPVDQFILLQSQANVVKIKTQGASRANRKRLQRLQSSTPHFLDTLLEPKTGVYTADFEQANGTIISVRDGTSAVLDCKVYLRHNKTVGQLN